ncbi:MAG: hypothetical protein IT529_02840 [Burkholderiales bacterium]|nr:hypothetical protein [Burkholderiales bacterium]
MIDTLHPGSGGAQRWPGSRQALTHVLLAATALAIATSLPALAELVLCRWWPRVAVDADLLVASEIALATALLVALNVTRVAWQNRERARVADAAALVYARENRGYLASWRERRMLRRLPPARDACVLTLSGFDTFAASGSLLNEPLAHAYEIRVLLLNPLAEGARRRVDALPAEVTLGSFAGEVEASIPFLAGLRRQGKAVTLRFYEREPFWKVAVLGDHAWVQHCHRRHEIKHEPEYVFALNRASPRRGLFVPFYRHFLDEWHDPAHPYYDFETGDLVYRDGKGRELCCEPSRPAGGAQ